MSKASKNDKQDGKPDYSLLPECFLTQVAYAMMAGEQKYGRYNYTKGHNLSQLTAAAVRHIKKIESGQDLDQDTSERIKQDVLHAANVCANMLMLIHQRELGTLVDDRFRPEPKPSKVVTITFVDKLGNRQLRVIPAAKLDEYRNKYADVCIRSSEVSSYFCGGKL